MSHTAIMPTWTVELEGKLIEVQIDIVTSSAPAVTKHFKNEFELFRAKIAEKHQVAEHWPWDLYKKDGLRELARMTHNGKPLALLAFDLLAEDSEGNPAIGLDYLAQYPARLAAQDLREVANAFLTWAMILSRDEYPFQGRVVLPMALNEDLSDHYCNYGFVRKAENDRDGCLYLEIGPERASAQIDTWK